MPKRKEPEERDPVLVAMGRRMRRHREATGLSQERFALKAGMDRTYYAAMELGYRNVSAKNLIRVALSLGVEVGDLFPDRAELGLLMANEADDPRP